MTLLGPSRAEGAAPTAVITGFLCSLCWSFATCRSLYPGGSAGCNCRLLPPHGSTSPQVRRVVFRIDFFEASSGVHSRYGLLLREVALRDPFHRRLRRVRFLPRRSDCYWAKRPFPGGTSTRWTKQVPQRTDQTSSPSRNRFGL